MAPGTTNAFLLSFASGRFVDSPKAGPQPGQAWPAGGSPSEREAARKFHGPKRIRRRCGEQAAQAISKIYSWRGLHATLKKKTLSTAPIKDLQQKCSSGSSSSKAVQAVSSSGVVHDPRCRPQDRPRPRRPRPSWYCRIAPYCVRWYHRGEQAPAPRQSTANQLLIHHAPAASTTPTRLLLQSTPSTPTTGRGRGRGRGRERSTTELEETSEPRMKSAFKKHCSALTPPERKSCFSSLLNA